MRSILCLLLLGLVAAPLSSSLAGPNAGGVLILHANPDLQWTQTGEYCGLSDLDDYADANVRVDGPGYSVIHVLAAFSSQSEPRMSGVTFGFDYDPAFVWVEHWASCGDFELHTGGWPGPNEGIAVTWSEAQTDSVTETLFLSVYSYYEDPGFLSAQAHPSGGGNFADDDVPSVVDPIADYGAIGFNTDGVLPAPEPPTTLVLTPPAITVYQPAAGSFPVELHVERVFRLASFEVCAGYDSGWLDFAGVVIDDSFLGSTGRAVLPGDPFPCSSDCQEVGININASTTGGGTGASGGGRLAQIYFEPLGAAAHQDQICLDDWELVGSHWPYEIFTIDAAPIELTHSAFCFGDFTGDGDVNVFDLARNIPAWHSCVGEEGYDAQYDVNLLEPDNYSASAPDGCIDVVDIQRVAGRWHLGCTETRPEGENEGATTGAEPTVRVTPDFQLVAGYAGDPVLVEIAADDVVNLGGFEIEISFDPTVVHAQSVERGDLLESTGRTAYPLSPEIDNTTGVIRFGDCTVGLDSGPTGSGVLSAILFEIQDCGLATDITIDDLTLTFVDGDRQETGQILGGMIQVDCATSVTPTEILGEMKLFPSRPNPMSAETEISFRIPTGEVSVALEIYDPAGRRIRSLFNGRVEAGNHVVVWDGSDELGGSVANGAYFSRLVVDGKILRERIVVVR